MLTILYISSPEACVDETTLTLVFKVCVSLLLLNINIKTWLVSAKISVKMIVIYINVVWLFCEQKKRHFL